MVAQQANGSSSLVWSGLVLAMDDDTKAKASEKGAQDKEEQNQRSENILFCMDGKRPNHELGPFGCLFSFRWLGLGRCQSVRKWRLAGMTKQR